MNAGRPDSNPISAALLLWRTERRSRIVVARDLCDRAQHGSREADHLLGAYVVAMVGEFQGFCADLLSSVVDALLSSLPAELSDPVHTALRTALTADRIVDTRNPTTANLTKDFIRFGMTLRGGLVAPAQLKPLEAVIKARNTLAHAGGDLRGMGRDGGALRLREARQWEHDLDALATTLDAAAGRHLTDRLSLAAW